MAKQYYVFETLSDFKGSIYCKEKDIGKEIKRKFGMGRFWVVPKKEFKSAVIVEKAGIMDE